MTTFRLRLPPTSNHGYRQGVVYNKKAGWISRPVKSDRLVAWEQEAAYTVRGWQPPKATPLQVEIRLEVPKGKMRQVDLDGLLKFLIDQTVGKRRDHYVDHLTVVKVEGEGWAEVTIEEIGARRES